MISLKKLHFIACCLLFSALANAQYITVDENMTIEDLVRNVLIDNSCANVSNISVNGLSINNSNSFGYFSAGSSSFPFAEGIVLSTGFAASAVGPNTNILSQGPTSWQGDADLEQALGISGSINATILEFDFLPLANKISFDYIFSSEQYLSSPSGNQCNYTDGFAFLLREVNSQDQYQNLAVVPNTNVPVKVNTVRGPGTICPAANEQYFDAFNGSEHPTNFNGQTVILTAEATVIPNTLYHIKLVVADQGNNLYDSAIFLGGGSFKVEKDLGADRLLATANPVCVGDSVVLDATEVGNNTYQWYKDSVSIPGETDPQYTVTSAGTYSVEITLGNTACISMGEITIEYTAAPTVNTPVTLIQCDFDDNGTAIFDLTLLNNQIAQGYVATFYETVANAENQTNHITNPQQYEGTSGTQLVAVVANSYGCKSFATVQLQLSDNTIAAQDPVTVCDTDGVADGLATFNLDTDVTPNLTTGLPSNLQVEYYSSIEDAEAQLDQLPNNFSNTIPNQQTIYAYIVNGSACYGITPITLNVSSFSPAGFEDETLFLCNGSSVTLQVPAGYSSYDWTNEDTDRMTTVSTPGTYSVTVTNAQGCSATKTFIVGVSGSAIFESVTINDFAGENNSVTINFSGTGVYEFSLDGENWQSSPVFNGLATGEYLVYIRDTNGCPSVGPISVYVLDYPHFFTPNGDGFNDIWRIRFPNDRASKIITIMDRYGKTLFSFSGNGSGWDGTFHSRQMPATDYWFVLELDDSRKIKGHFSLKR
ncbi:MAG TPA: choice-of-anchor L domain-containing protein [Flavobacterium sp.]|jgi:gliding motility-associated-like protein